MILQRVHLKNDTHRFSVMNFGKMMDPNFLAALFVLPIVVCFYRYIKNGFKIREMISMLILLFALLATGSRGLLFLLD